MEIRAKNILRVGDTLCDQWKCVTHEKFVLELDAIGYNYEKTFWKELCDVAENSQCWLSECDLYRDGQNFKPWKPMDVIVNYKQFTNSGKIFTPKWMQSDIKRIMRTNLPKNEKASNHKWSRCLVAKCLMNLKKYLKKL